MASRPALLLAWALAWSPPARASEPPDDLAAASGEDDLPPSGNLEDADWMRAPDAPGGQAPLWMDLYGEGQYETQEERDPAGYLETKLGKRWRGPFPVDAYVKTRVGADARDHQWNNRADLGLGLRLHLLTGGAQGFLFGEAMGGFYLRTRQDAPDIQILAADEAKVRQDIAAVEASHHQVEEQLTYAELGIGNPDSLPQTLKPVVAALGERLTTLNARLDTLQRRRDSLGQAVDALAAGPSGPGLGWRAGAVFSTDWGAPQPEVRRDWIAFPGRAWGQIYGEFIYSDLRTSALRRDTLTGALRGARLAQRDWVFDLNPDIGLVGWEGRLGALIPYLDGFVAWDSRGEYWNNKAQAGPALRYQPVPGFDLALYAGHVWGRYFGRQTAANPNPSGPRISAWTAGANIWYGLGL